MGTYSDEYDVDALRELVEDYFYKIFQKTHDKEDEVRYIEACWKSNSEIVSIAGQIGIDIEEFKISRKARK